jgi:hypothetical protein
MGEYQLGGRSALEWVLEQHEERTPKGPTIRASFNACRFADHKEEVIALLKRFARVSIGTVAVTGAMRQLPAPRATGEDSAPDREENPATEEQAAE